MVKRKKQRASHRTLQNAVVAAINDPSYSFSLPQLADWESVVSSSVDEKQRLEFVGDAIMHLSVALYLYRLFPNATPGFYTNIRSAMNTNATFTHLMAKAGAYEIPSQSHTTKAVADSFEVIVAALYMERGLPDVCAWVQEQYAPLVTAARKSYDKSLATSDPNVSSSTKRRAGPLDPADAPLLKKIKPSSGRSVPRSALMAQRVIKRMRSKGKVKLYLPKKPDLPLKMRLRSRKLRASEPMRTSSIVIDLTTNGDSESKEPTPTQASQTNFELPASSRLSPSLPTPEFSQSFKDTYLLRLPKQGSTASLGLLREPSELPSSLCTPATSLGNPSSIVSRSNLRLSQTGLSLSPQLDRTHSLSGTYENPIVIEDSDTES